MSVPFSYIITPESIVFTAPTGKTITVTSDNPVFVEVKDLVREIGKETVAFLKETLINGLIDLVTPAKLITDKSDGRVTVRDGVVYYGNEAVHSAIADRILWGLSEGFNMDPYMAFLENVMKNPSKRAVDQLYGYIERNKMGITEDGFILAYKRVRDDFMDIYSGTFDNSPGQYVSMPRNKVNDDPNMTCSDGLHFCSQSYLPHYGASPGNTVVILKINPADVVSIPLDYDGKGRCCGYLVLGEYKEADKFDLLSSMPVFRDHDFSSDEDEDLESDEDSEYLDDSDEDSEDDTIEISDETSEGSEWGTPAECISVENYSDVPALTTSQTSVDEDAGYNSGYARGVEDAKDMNLKFPRDHELSDHPWSNGFIRGWRDGMLASGRVPDEDLVEVQPVVEDTVETTDVPVLGDSPVVIPSATPIVDIPVSVQITIGDDGSFRIG